MNDDEENEMGISVWDEDDDGIALEIPVFGGVTLKVYMDDVTAQEVIDIIQNKLEGHWYKKQQGEMNGKNGEK